MRLLHLHNRYRSAQPSGETVRVIQETEILHRAGHVVSLMVIDNDRIDDYGLLRRATVPFRATWSTSSHRVVGSLIREFRPDVVHIHNTLPLASPSVLWAARRSGVPVVCTVDNYRLMCPQGMFLRAGAPCEDCVGRAIPWPAVLHACYRGSRPASATVAAMLAVHRGMRTWTEAVDVMLIGSEFGRRKHIEAGFPEDLIVSKPNSAPDPGRVRRGPGTHYAFVGRLAPEKGVDTLISAWGRARLPPHRELRIAGEGPDRARLQDLARTLGAPRIRFLGGLPKDRVTEELLEARALVSPSVAYEVAPLSVIEAFAAGVPCVVTTGGAQAEMVEEDQTGLLFPARNEAALAAALIRLEDDALSVRLGGQARRTYEQRHSEQAVLDSLDRAYGLAVRRGKGRTPSRRDDGIPDRRTTFFR